MLKWGMEIQHRVHLRIILALVAALATGARAEDSPPTFTAAELRADLAETDRALHEMPPDLARSADLAELDKAFKGIEATLATTPPLDREAAWRLFATLNPILADGHLFVGFVDWRGDTRVHLAAGGVLFPFEMRVTPQCDLRVHAALGGGSTTLEGKSLTTINGVSAREICEALLARAHGETRKFRADLVSRRFWFFYWKMYGAPKSFELGIGGEPAAKQVPASAALPLLLATEDSFERQFRLELMPGNTAVLTLGSFALPDKKPLLEFTQSAFEKLRDAGTRTLIIDLRDNGGGDDVMWLEGVMPYIAQRPFRTGSTYRKRVVVADPEKGEVAGTVVDGQIETWFGPQPQNPRFFKGELFVLVGPGTYSSAVLFSNVVQDFHFGRIVGSGGSVRANQSGGARRTTLTNTGLIVVAPRFVLTRPSGSKGSAILSPDIELDISQPIEAIAAQLAHRK